MKSQVVNTLDFSNPLESKKVLTNPLEKKKVLTMQGILQHYNVLY